ncbi:MAG: class I SAM-dependent methyltransferase [bacterium]|nr:class I SAM-dependent methyltransferase [bacterium]
MNFLFCRGSNIAGCDYSEVAIQKVNNSNPELDIRVGNITSLPYGNEQFDNILALGVYHSIEKLEDIDRAVKETVRCLKSGGHMVASVRADNLENWLIDFISDLKGAKGEKFHKWCFKQKEFMEILKKQFLDIERCELVTNVPFLHKFRIFRKSKDVDEKIARSQGFQLNFVGNLIYKFLKLISPKSFGTTIVVTAQKIVS